MSSDTDDKPFFLNHLQHKAVSHLIPYSSLVLTVSALVVFLIRLYIIDRWLMRTAWYSRWYDKLDEVQKRSFVNHHIAALLKIVLLVVGAFPVVEIISGRGTYQTPYIRSAAGNSLVTCGDMLVVCFNVLTAMYIFELIFRSTVSYVSVAHHMGAVMIAQTTMVLTLRTAHQPTAVFQFTMCLLWGAFDILAELWPHLVMIIYRMKRENHALLAKLLLGVSYLELFSTITETVVIFWYWGNLWPFWTASFKVCVPILHTLFAIAQLWGFWVLRGLGLKELKKAQSENS